MAEVSREEMDACEAGWHAREAALRGCRVVSTGSRGKCVVASRELQPGDLLLREYAVCGVSTNCLHSGPLPWSGGFPPLDGPESFLLQILQRKTSKGDPETPQLMGVLALRLLRAARVDPSSKCVMLSLCHLPVPLSQSLEALVSALLMVLECLDPLPPQADELEEIRAKECRQVVGSLSCNLFTVTDAELIPEAVALFPSAALFNHSCTPAACQVFPHCTATSGNASVVRLLELRASRVVQPGEEVCISYIDSGQPREERRRVLFNNYGFICSCIRCAVTDCGDAWRCSSASCRGLYTLTSSFWRQCYQAWLQPYASSPLPQSDFALVPVASHTVFVHAKTSPSVEWKHDDCSGDDASFSPDLFRHTQADALVPRKPLSPCWPDSSELGWLYDLLYLNDQIRSRSTRVSRSTLTHELDSLARMGVWLVCHVCGDKQSLCWVVEACRALSHVAFSSKHRPVDQWVGALVLLQQRVPLTHYLIFDWGTKTCLSLIHAQRYTDALSVCGAVLTTLQNLYPLTHPAAMVQMYQACKLLRLLGRSDMGQPGTGVKQLLARAVLGARILHGPAAGDVSRDDVVTKIESMTL